ncbi:MAG: hypothetical protein ACM3QS_11815 [Bacteroidota bacterium]
MRLLVRYLLLLVGITAWSWAVFPARYGVEFPRQPGPRFDSQIRLFQQRSIDTRQPEVVLVGDSTLEVGVDADELGRLTQRSTLSIAIPGSASAVWYLLLKNNIVDALHPPRTLVIIERDTILTAPGYRVQGSYFKQIDEFAGRNEPLLLQRSFLNQMNPVERAAEKYIPLYGARMQARDELDRFVRYSLPGLAGCDPGCTDNAMYSTFGAGDLEPGELRNAVSAAEQYLYTSRQLNFHEQVEQSFLPEIIRLAQEHHIQLIVVRLKTYASGMGDLESAALKRYVRDLSGYLHQNNVVFLDFGNDPRLRREFFADPIHLNEQGRKTFTVLLAEALRQVLR